MRLLLRQSRCGLHGLGDSKNELASSETLGILLGEAFAALARRIRARRCPEFDRVASGTIRASDQRLGSSGAARAALQAANTRPLLDGSLHAR